VFGNRGSEVRYTLAFTAAKACVFAISFLKGEVWVPIGHTTQILVVDLNNILFCLV